MKILRNLILCTLLLGSQALVAGGEKLGGELASDHMKKMKKFNKTSDIGQTVAVKRKGKHVYGKLVKYNDDGTQNVEVEDNNVVTYNDENIFMLPGDEKESKKESPKADAKESKKEAGATVPSLGDKAEAVLTLIQKRNNNCSRETAYALFLHSLPSFELGHPAKNIERLAKHNIGVKEKEVTLETYKHLREAHKQLTAEQRKVIYTELGVTPAQYKIMENSYLAMPQGRVHQTIDKGRKPRKAQKEEAEDTLPDLT